MNNTIDQEVIETPAEATVEPSVTETQENSEPEVDWRTKAAELEEKNRMLYARLKREEKKEAPAPAQAKPTGAPVLSAVDQYNLIKADVHPDDIGEVLEYAAFKGISVSDALKSNVVKSTLADKKSERETAAATSVKGTARTTSKVSDEVLMAKASQGELPDSDDDLSRLLSKRYGK